MEDQPLVRTEQERLRRNPLQLQLDRKHILAARQPGAIGHAKNVRIDGDRRLAKSNIQNDVGGLAADPGQGLELVAVGWNLAAVLLDQLSRRGDHVFRLGVKQADGLDRLAQIILAKLDHLLRGGDSLEQRTAGLVDADVGRLGGQRDRDQQGVGIEIFKLGLRIGVGLRQAAIKFERIGLVHAAPITSRMV